MREALYLAFAVLRLSETFPSTLARVNRSFPSPMVIAQTHIRERLLSHLREPGGRQGNNLFLSLLYSQIFLTLITNVENNTQVS